MKFPKKKYTIHDNCLTESLETKHSEAVLDSSAQKELADGIEKLIIEERKYIIEQAKELDERGLFVKEMDGSMSRLHNCEMEYFMSELEPLIKFLRGE